MSKSREISQIGTRVNVDDTTGDLTAEGRLITDATQDATTIDDGSIQTDGGISSTKSIYVGPDGKITTDNTTESTSPTTGSIQTDGGLGVVKDTHIGGDLDVAGRITSSTIEALTIANYIDQDLIYPFIDGQDGTAKDFDNLTDHSTVPGVKVDTLGRIRFYTQIIGRKPIKNPMIGMKLGMERHTFDSLQLLDDEKGPNGENVYSVDGRDWVRAIGDTWTILNNTRGNSLSVGGAVGTSSIELISYFDSGNLLSNYVGNGVLDLAETFINGNNQNNTQTTDTTVESPLVSRYLDSAIILPQTIDAVLGLNTLQFVSNHTAVGGALYYLGGIELGVTSSTDLTIFPQTVISNGEKIEIPYSNSEGYKPDVSAANYGTSENNGEFDIGLSDWQKDYQNVNKTTSDYNSATAYDLDDSNTKLLLGLDGDLRDRSGQGHKVKNELGVKFENIIDPFGNYSKSAYFINGSNLNIINAVSKIDFTVSWTVDFRFKLSVLQDYEYLIRFGQDGGFGLLIYVTAAGNLVLYLSSNGSSWDILNASAGSTVLTVDTFYHLALVRDKSGSTYKTYLNGAQEHSVSTATDIFDDFTKAHIGISMSNADNTWIQDGWVSNFRITESALWTAAFDTDAFITSPSPLNSVLLPNDLVYDSTDSAIYKATFTDADYKTDGSDAGITWETIDAAVNDTALTGTDLMDDEIGLTVQGYFENARSRYYNVTSIAGGATYPLATFETFTEAPFNGGRCVWFSHPDYNSGQPLSAVNWLPKYAQSIAHVDIQHNDPTNALPEFEQKLETLTADIVEITGLTDHDTVAKHSSYSSETGNVSSSAVYSDVYLAWKLFDKVNPVDHISSWITEAGTTGWITYQYFVSQKITKYKLQCRVEISDEAGNISFFPSAWTLYGSNTGEFTGEQVTLDTRSGESVTSMYQTNEYTIATPSTYLYYKLDITNNNGGSYVGLSNLELLSDTSRTQQLYDTIQKHYGYTNETGTVSSPTSIYGAFYPWYAFNKVVGDDVDCFMTDTTAGEVTYEYIIPQKIISYSITAADAAAVNRNIKNFTINGSNDGSNWTVLDTQTDQTPARKETKIYPLSNSTTYKYYKLIWTANNGDVTYSYVGELYLLTDELVRDKVFYQNEEMCKKLHWREFGNGDKNQVTDTGFDTMDNTDVNDRAFTLDDGLTTLVSDDGYCNTTSGAIGPSNVDDFIIFTFIGSGIAMNNDYIKNIYSQGSSLFYGTHTFKLKAAASGGFAEYFLDGVSIVNSFENNMSITNFRIYQPSQPELPEGAVILADYMLMADYVPVSESDLTTISKGVRRVHNTRDIFYNQTSDITIDWRNAGINTTMIGWFDMNVGNEVTTAYQELPFYGDGICIRSNWLTNHTTSITIEIDGSTDLSAYDITLDSHGSLVAATGIVTIDTSVNTYASFINISGLELGNHTVKISYTTGVGTYGYGAIFDIHSPIHRANHYSNISYNPYVSPEIIGGGDGISNNDLIVNSKGEVLSEVNRPDKLNSNIVVKIASTAANQIIANLNLELRRGLDRFNMYMKGWQAIGTTAQAVICLEPGEYNISFSSIASTNNVTAQMWVNGVFVQGRELTAVTGSTDMQHSQYFEYGDIVNISGNGAAVVTVETYATNLTITKIED